MVEAENGRDMVNTETLRQALCERGQRGGELSLSVALFGLCTCTDSVFCKYGN